MSTPASPAAAAAGKSVAESSALDAASASEVRSAKRRRPMSVPTRRLETTLLPGFHLHWIKDQNLPQAYGAAYVHVLDNEVEINTRNVALDTTVGSTADLSNRVSIQYGGDTLYLMKLNETLYNEDMAILAERNAVIWRQIFRGEQIAGSMAPNPGDTSQTYVKTAKADGADLARAKSPLFSRKFK